MNPAGPDPPDVREWRRRRAVAQDYFVPWLERMRPLAGTTVLEYGCGAGPVCAALAPHVGQYVGYDIDERAIEIGRSRLEECGSALNVRLHSLPPDRILDAVATSDDQPDLILLYAVLEHMTVRERLDLLECAFRKVKPDGLVAIVESPNRLAPVDWHTSFLPFFCQLPEPLALEYSRRSPREDFRVAITEAVGIEAKREKLTRWGRGISFHELELVLGDLREHVVGGGYDPALLPERPVHPEEQILARQLERTRPDMPPVFGRYWLDVALAPTRVDPSKTRVVWPWMMETRRSPGAHWTRWETIELEEDAVLAVDLPVPSQRIVAIVSLPEPAGEVTMRAGDDAVSQPVEGSAGNQLCAQFELSAARAEMSLSLSHAGYVHFVGYEASGARNSVPLA